MLRVPVLEKSETKIDELSKPEVKGVLSVHFMEVIEQGSEHADRRKSLRRFLF